MNILTIRDILQSMVRRAVAYVKAEGPETDSPPDPEELRVVREYAQEHGYTVTKVVSDQNRSGLDLRTGAPIVQALETLFSNDAEVLLAPALSSLPGDVFDQEALLAHLQEYGFPFVAAIDDGTLQHKSENRALLRQFAARTILYGNRLEAIRLGVARRVATNTRGTRQGPRPYGEGAGEAPILNRIKELWSKGTGYAPIANQLNAEGIKPRRGKKWYPTTIANILGARDRARARQRARMRRS